MSTLQIFLLSAMVPASITALTWWRWARLADRHKNTKAPVGHMLGMALVFGVALPSGLSWLAWLLWGALNFLTVS